MVKHSSTIVRFSILSRALVLFVLALVTALPAVGQSGDFLPVSWVDDSAALDGFQHGGSSGDSLSGVAWLDYDGDGWLDLYATNGIGHADALLHNNGDGTFTEVGEAAGIADGNGSAGVVGADLDNDGDPDLVVTGDSAAFNFFSTVISARAVRLFENLGDGTFADITEASGLGVVPAIFGAVLQPALGDIDNDGLLDIFITAPATIALVDIGAPLPPNHLFHNQGGLRFTEIGEASGLGYEGGACSAAFSNYDDDEHIDIFVADCNVTLPPPGPGQAPGFVPTPIRLYRNNGDLTFSRLEGLGLPEPSGETVVPTDERGFWMCVGLGDIDNDLDLDLFSTNLGHLPFLQDHILLERLDDGTFRSIEMESGISAAVVEWGWGCTFADFNNDSWEDLVIVGNQPASGVLINPGHLLVNLGDGTFRREPLAADLTSRFGSGLATADYDGDGDIDAVVGIGGLPELLDTGPGVDAPLLARNEGNGNNSLTLRLRGTVSNRDGIGARIFVRSEGNWRMKEVRAGAGFLSQDSPWPSFGLGLAESAVVDVVWPSGHRNRLYNVKAGRTTRFPELPCSFDNPDLTLSGYLECVTATLDHLVDERVIRRQRAVRILISALRAWASAHP